MYCIIVGHLCKWEELSPVVLLVANVTSQVLFHDAICTFTYIHPIHLGMMGRVKPSSAKQFQELLPKLQSELNSAILNDKLQSSMEYIYIHVAQKIWLESVLRESQGMAQNVFVWRKGLLSPKLPKFSGSSTIKSIDIYFQALGVLPLVGGNLAFSPDISLPPRRWGSQPHILQCSFSGMAIRIGVLQGVKFSQN